MFQTDIGDLSSNDLTMTELDIPSGATVTVTNLAASPGTITYYTSDDGTGTGTIAPGGNQSFTVGPVYLTVPGSIASIQITGGNY